ncbi:hypothetical protein CN563_00175 [Bacillus sp. AFS026049]|nr:hypothetical protein CN563_00175 [Bacillus sp. AFS026049]
MPKGRVLSPVGHVPTRKGKVQPQVGKLLILRVAIQTLLQQIPMPKDFRLRPVDLRPMLKGTIQQQPELIRTPKD